MARRHSTLDRWLPAWIGLAMLAWLPLGRFVPALSDVGAHGGRGHLRARRTGLLAMMYPVLAKVRYALLLAGRARVRLEDLPPSDVSAPGERPVGSSSEWLSSRR